MLRVISCAANNFLGWRGAPEIEFVDAWYKLLDTIEHQQQQHEGDMRTRTCHGWRIYRSGSKKAILYRLPGVMPSETSSVDAVPSYCRDAGDSFEIAPSARLTRYRNSELH